MTPVPKRSRGEIKALENPRPPLRPRLGERSRALSMQKLNAVAFFSCSDRLGAGFAKNMTQLRRIRLSSHIEMEAWSKPVHAERVLPGHANPRASSDSIIGLGRLARRGFSCSMRTR